MGNANGRDELGRFTEGNHPKTGFHTNPERRATFPGNRHSVSKSAQRFLDMTDAELEETKNNPAPLTQAERITLSLISQARDENNPKQLEALRQLLDRAEGKPRQSVDIDAQVEQYQPPRIIVCTFAEPNPLGLTVFTDGRVVDKDNNEIRPPLPGLEDDRIDG